VTSAGSPWRRALALGRHPAPRPGQAAGQGTAQPARARHPGADRAGLLEPWGRRPPVHQRGHGQDPRTAHLRQAGRQRPRRRGGGRVRAGPAAPAL